MDIASSILAGCKSSLGHAEAMKFPEVKFLDLLWELETSPLLSAGEDCVYRPATNREARAATPDGAVEQCYRASLHPSSNQKWHLHDPLYQYYDLLQSASIASQKPDRIQ